MGEKVTQDTVTAVGSDPCSPSQFKYFNPRRIQGSLLLQKVEKAMTKGHFILAKYRGITVEK